MKKWMVRAKFNRSLIHKGHSKSWTYKDGQFLFYGKTNWHSKNNGTLFKTESSAKTYLSLAKNMIDEGWHWPVEELKIIEVKVTIG